MRGFYELAGFPKVIGAIDETLIPIRTSFKNEHLYVCHKGFHVINVMATCNATLLFTNVVAKWHGSTHDSAVFNASVLNINSLRVWRWWRRWLLGDRGYALTPVMMTPFHPDKMTSNAERKYQKAHTKTRNVIERSFGVLKQRFRCLDFSEGAMQFSPSRFCKIILATAVLHIMCIIDNTPLPETVGPFEDDGDHHQEICHEPPSTSGGVTVRQKLIRDVSSWCILQ